MPCHTSERLTSEYLLLLSFLSSLSFSEEKGKREGLARRGLSARGRVVSNLENFTIIYKIYNTSRFECSGKGGGRKIKIFRSWATEKGYNLYFNKKKFFTISYEIFIDCSWAFLCFTIGCPGQLAGRM